jgi:outer membrane protein
MKKIILGLALAGSFASADFLSLSAGAGIWQQNISGYAKAGDTINYFNNKSAETDGNSNSGNLGLQDKSNPYVWVKFIYPIPILPNIKLQYTKYDTSGHSDYIAGDVKIGDVTLNGALTNADTTQTIDSYDATFFYEFKPVVADIEAGFGVDYWQGHTTIHATSGGVTKNWVDNDWAIPLPYLYGHIETMQLFGLSFLGNVKWAEMGDSHHYDYSGAVKYTIDIVGPVNPFIKVGYRYKDLKGTDGDTTTVLKYQGAYAEIGAKF